VGERNNYPPAGRNSPRMMLRVAWLLVILAIFGAAIIGSVLDKVFQ
jgi:hypothetical protein